MNKSKLVLFGTSGQLGGFLLKLLPQDKFDVIGLNHSRADLGNPAGLANILDELNPRWVINAAAYTDVPKAESEKEDALTVNAEAPAAMARWCAAHDCRFVSFSTDYVFSGTHSRPQLEDETPNPLNSYGLSKLTGEDLIKKAGGSFLIFRTSWIYSEVGKNFLLTMLRLGSEKEELSVVADQWGAPTYARDLAEATVKIIANLDAARDFPSGIYHLCNSGETNWFEFAQAIFRYALDKKIHLRVKNVKAVTSQDYPSTVVRPMNSRLAMDKVKNTFGIEMRAWDKALRECMEHLK